MMSIIQTTDPTRPYTDALSASVLSAISGGAQTFDAVRKAMSMSAKQLPDGWIHQMCIDNDIAVSRE